MTIWKEGQYVDAWSVVHLLSGVILGGALFHIESSPLLATLVAITLLIFWEVLEWQTGIVETRSNIVVDVLIGLGGFLSYYLGLKEGFVEFSQASYITTIAITCALALWGYLDFLLRR